MEEKTENGEVAENEVKPVKQTKKQLFWEIFRFLLVGGTATVADYAVAYIFYHWLLPPNRRYRSRNNSARNVFRRKFPARNNAFLVNDFFRRVLDVVDKQSYNDVPCSRLELRRQKAACFQIIR